ncbi:MAG TPA: hypothetical protein VGP25_19480 [Gemmatimonadaceae bacterium]|nr:hypothetical protein [Gemmatimonadaceae bacterium]
MRHLAAGALLVAIAPWPAQAQFGMLKKLKNKVSAPDSTARATDSLAQVAAGVSPDSVKIGKGLLARGMSAAGAASDKLEKTTGISAKDAALAATGIGATGLIAKKMGVDPMSMGANMMNNAKLNAKQRAMNAATGVNAAGAIPGMPNMAALQGMQSKMMQAGMARGAGKSAAGVTGKAPTAAAMGMTGVPNFTEADAQALLAFQQEMMQVATAASTGDVAAKARLDAWQALSVKHEAEIEKLALSAQGGDMAAMQKLQMMQYTMMKEWASTGTTKAKVLRAVKP